MKLEPIHYQAIFLLVSGRSVAQVAKKLETTQNRVNGWKQEDNFSLALQTAYSRIYDDALNKLATIALKAADYLEDIIDDQDVPTRIKLQAINIVLSHGQKVKDYQLNARMDKLEEMAFNDLGETDENIEE